MQHSKLLVMIDMNDLRMGVESAFEDLFQLYHQKLYYFFLKHTRDTYQAEELVQITFLKIWQSKSNLSINHTIAEQVFRVAKTCMIDSFRKALGEKKLQGKISSLESTQQVQEIIPELELKNSFEKGLEQLPAAQQNVFRLSRMSGLTNREIAAQLEISIKTVERHITKALRHLNDAIFS